MSTESVEDFKDPFGVTVDKNLSKLYKLSENYTMDSKKKSARLVAWTQKIVTSVDEYLSNPSSTFSSEPQSDLSLPPSRSQLYYWRGRALDAGPTYSAEAEETLARAVKLEPALVEAWNCLANCYWKNKNYKQAYSCLLTALDQKKTQRTLQMLSMVVKQVPSDSRVVEEIAKEKSANASKSVAYAREAVALDIKDGESWYIYGNALLNDFFVNTKDRGTLQSALKAYAQSESKCNTNPDLFFNRGNICKYFEDYEAAVAAFKRAAELDPSLPAAAEIENLRSFVKRVAKQVSSKMGLKPRKIASTVERMPETAHMFGIETKTASCSLSALSEGDNEGKHFIGIILDSVSRTDSTPVSFLVVDGEGVFSVVSLYNVTADVSEDVKPDQILYIKNPIRKNVSVTEPGSHFAYPTVHCTSPNLLLVDGVKLIRSNVAAAEIKMEGR
jgi:tetratricopeptide (TPR) repeat protein